MSLNQQIESLQISDIKNIEVNKLINEIQELYCKLKIEKNQFEEEKRQYEIGKNNILDKDEPLLNEEERLVVYPIKHKQFFDEYKKQLGCLWTVEEIDLSKDHKDWNKLNDDERHFVKYILGFFAASDGIVNMNIGERFLKDVKILEAQMAYRFQAAMEDIHAEMYSLMIDTYIKDDKEKKFIFNAIENIPCIKKKAEWAKKWIDDKNASFAQRLVAFACVEGIFFSGSFCAIYWLKERNLMPGLCNSNEFIARDEGLHCTFACKLYSNLVNKLSYETIKEMVNEVVEIETEFITKSLPCRLIGMNSFLMTQYIKFVADKWVRELGYKNIFNVRNPFDFMENISLQSKTNFFENRPTEYKKSEVKEFKIDDDF
jgi:ribonucleotide reductase beta subunit family protein with ferritin-like domain